MTERRRYYSERTGKHPTGGQLEHAGLIYLFECTMRDLERKGLLQEWYGYRCVDAGEVSGNAGEDVEAFIFRKLRKGKLWPIEEHSSTYTEDDLFDMIELLFDTVSRGDAGRLHSYLDCGWHYETFDRAAGQAEFRLAMNEILHDWKDGFELLANGEVVSKAPEGLGDLYDPVVAGDPVAVRDRTAQAVSKFRRRGATADEQRDAVRDLVDVLEYLRPQAKALLHRQDEADLFNIANNFGIRHHRPDQQTAYTAEVWLPWMFYHYLATIHALTRLMSADAQRGKDDDALPF